MPADHPYAELNEARDQCKQHADLARDLAHQAMQLLPENESEAQVLASLSTAHSLAALATAAGGGGILSIEDLGR